MCLFDYLSRQSHEPTIVAIVHWDRLKTLFDQAHALPPERRAAFLDQVCRDDAALREQLASLLAAQGQAADYFENFAAAVLPAPLKHRMNRQPENRQDPLPDLPLLARRGRSAFPSWFAENVTALPLGGESV